MFENVNIAHIIVSVILLCVEIYFIIDLKREISKRLADKRKKRKSQSKVGLSAVLKDPIIVIKLARLLFASFLCVIIIFNINNVYTSVVYFVLCGLYLFLDLRHSYKKIKW